ncbi:MarC family protein [Hyphomicrobium sp.]|uniref:MarC family protein n=1 Tax=Hyphomicrobium sp. TaxID=82 RepID=UPI000FB9B684|nr:MarC family protein [Hyphomicrobium sp.]RUP00404.1 MAG: MarC family protein [Hyphomicrobium sp.]
MAYLSSIIASFLVAFPALFSIVNPFGGALIYSQITLGRPHPERVFLAWRVAAYSAIVMLVSLLIGATLMSFFGVSIDALRVAGGTVVAVSGWRMLYNPQETEDRKQDHASDTRRATAWSSDVAFFPLTMPFTTGPGTISVAIALSSNRPPDAAELLPFFCGLCGAAIAVALTIGFCYSSADRLVSLLGPGRARILTRLSAFLLLCIGVQILITGIQGALVSVIAAHR